MQRHLLKQIPFLLAVIALVGVLAGCEPNQPEYQTDYPAPQQPQEQSSEGNMPAYPQQQDDSQTQQEAPMQWPAE